MLNKGEENESSSVGDMHKYNKRIHFSRVLTSEKYKVV